MARTWFCFGLAVCLHASLFGAYCEGERFKRAHAGVCILDVETGEEVYSQNPEQFFVSASLQKIPLGAAAIALLGPEFRFRTELALEGSIDKEGAIQGNLWIRGGGDPTFSMDTLTAWEAELKKLGIQKIQGKIIADSSCFETALASPYWYFEDLGNYYGAGPSGLSINENTYRITFQPGKKEGDPAAILKTEPYIPGLIARNEVTTGPPGSGDQVFVFGSEYSPVQFYRGTVPIDQESITIKAAIPDPAQFCASALFAKVPALQGFDIANAPPAYTLMTLCRKESIPVKEIVRKMNLHSVNLYAEHLFKALGSGKGRQGRIVLEQFLKGMGIPAQVRDGSGLARTNLITPRGFAALLREIHLNPLFLSIFDSFPEPGKPGSLKTFPPLANAHLKGKTGSMSNINNLAGYLTLPSGKTYVFVLLCNNFEGPIRDLVPEMHRFLEEMVKKI